MSYGRPRELRKRREYKCPVCKQKFVGDDEKKVEKVMKEHFRLKHNLKN